MTASARPELEHDPEAHEASPDEAAPPIPLSVLAGYQAIGRHGQLGTVVRAADDDTLAVVGGVSGLLRFHVPRSRIRSVSPVTGTIVVDLDVADFTPREEGDGSIHLYLTTHRAQPEAPAA
jgi:hypothetical protein